MVSSLSAFIINYIQGHDNFWYLFVLAVFHSLFQLNLKVFIGREQIFKFNLFGFFVPLLVAIFILLVYFFSPFQKVDIYFWGYGIAHGIAWLTSFILVFPVVEWRKIFDWHKHFRKAFTYGFFTASSNLLQFLNYRLSYFFILYFKDMSAVGIFSIGIALAEATWIISKSVALVQYSRIINTKNLEENISHSKIAAKISFYLTVFIVAAMILIPPKVYQFVFGEEFLEIKKIILYIVPGILSISISNTHGHFFSAIGKLKQINIKSLIGLAATVVLSILLIPRYDIVGACLAASVAYFLSSVYLLIEFYRLTKFSFSDLILSKKDFRFVSQANQDIKN